MDLTVICALVIILGIILIVYMVQKQRDRYEITQLVFDVCRHHCLDEGSGHGVCADNEILKDCIERMVKVVGVPPPGTSFADPVDS